MRLPSYATREDVKLALDIAETARINAQIDRLLASSSRGIEGLTHRKFFPQVDSRSFPWPAGYARPWRLWLGQHELVSVSELTSGGNAIDAADFFLEPNGSGPPFTSIELDLSSSAAFGGGATHQRDITVAGVFGYRDDTEPAGQLAAAVDGSATAVTVSDSAAVGIGDLVEVDDERMIVTGRSMASTGQTLQTPVTSAMSSTSLAVTDGSAYHEGELLLLDAERMRVVDIAGNSLIVQRAADGSPLAAHNGSTIYAPRTLTVERGALGTTAAAHNDETAVARHAPPEPVRQLCIAETLVGLGREQTGYARTIGTGDNQRAAPGGDLRDLRAVVRTRYGRKARTDAI